MSRLIDADAFDERVRVAGGMSEEELTEDFKDGVQAVLYMLSNQPTIQPEPHWIPVTERLPEEERECWITPKTTSKIYRGIFTRHYGECHRTGFICDDGFMWLNTALAWMYCEVPEPYKAEGSEE